MSNGIGLRQQHDRFSYIFVWLIYCRLIHICYVYIVVSVSTVCLHICVRVLCKPQPIASLTVRLKIERTPSADGCRWRTISIYFQPHTKCDKTGMTSHFVVCSRRHFGKCYPSAFNNWIFRRHFSIQLSFSFNLFSKDHVRLFDFLDGDTSQILCHIARCERALYTRAFVQSHMWL